MRSQILMTLKYSLKNFASQFGLEITKRNPNLDTGLVTFIGLREFLDWYLNTLDHNHFFFIQIGANDGRMHDPLHAIIKKYKLKGLLIEPQPNVFEKLKENYTGQDQLIFENSAIAEQSGTLPFYSISDALYIKDNDFNFSGMSSFSREHAVKNFYRFAKRYNVKGSADDHIKTINVSAITFSDLLKKHNIERYDLLQIDAEGYDFEIIKTLDFSAHKPRIIHFEHNSLSPNDRKACWELLRENGYINGLCGTDTLSLLIDKKE
jgi:FkbM family methyltransferase